MKNNQTVKADMQSPSALMVKSSQSPKETIHNPCLNKDKEYVPSHSSLASINNITQVVEVIANVNDISLIPLTLQGQVDSSCSYRPMDCSEVQENTVLMKTNNNSGRKISYERTHCNKVAISQNSIILAKHGKSKRRVTFSEDSKQCYLDDHKFRDSKEDVPQLLTPETISKNNRINSERYIVAALIRSDSNEDEDSHGVSLLDPPNSPDVDKQSNDDVTEYTSSCLSPAVTRVSCHALVVPLCVAHDSRLYHILPLFGRKEKLTRRQMIQLAAMMGLGFIFVGLILVWVFSPVLF